MVQCEMCGAETPSPKTVKIEGAELSVCADCAGFGTEVSTGTESSTSTKYSTSSSSGQTADSGSGSSGGQSGGSRRRRDMFDEMDEVVTDYDAVIRQARESAGLSQAELADQLNEKASQIRKLERGETLPSDQMRRKLERALDIDLIEGGGTGAEEDADWSGGAASGGITLGDVVERKE